MRIGQRHGQQRVRAQPALGVGAVERNHLGVDTGLIARIAAEQGLFEHRVDVLDSLQDSLAPVALLVAIPQLDGLTRAGGRSRRDRGATEDTGIENDVGLDRRVAAGIDDFAAADIGNSAHDLSIPRQQRFFEGPGLHGLVQLPQRGQQRLHAVERPGVGTVRERLGRIGVSLHEQAGHSGSHGAARQDGNEFALAT